MVRLYLNTVMNWNVCFGSVFIEKDILLQPDVSDL